MRPEWCLARVVLALLLVRTESPFAPHRPRSPSRLSRGIRSTHSNVGQAARQNGLMSSAVSDSVPNGSSIWIVNSAGGVAVSVSDSMIRKDAD